jgi:hypothetical protein
MTPKRAGSLMTAFRSPGLGSAKMTATSSALYTHRSNAVLSRVVDPDRSDPKLLAESGSGSGENHSRSGSGQLRIRNKFEVKLLCKTDKS